MLKYILIFTLIATGSLNCMQSKTYGSKTRSGNTTSGNLSIPQTQGYKRRPVNTTQPNTKKRSTTKKPVALSEEHSAALAAKYTAADKENLIVETRTKKQEKIQERAPQTRTPLSFSRFLTPSQKYRINKQRKENGYCTIEEYNGFVEAETLKITSQSTPPKSKRLPAHLRPIYGTPIKLEHEDQQ